jgi:hypothetical protein
MSGIREADFLDSVFQLAWGLGLEPRFSDSKSDVLPIRRPPKHNRKWLGDQESNLDSQIQNLMSYQLDDPQKQEPQQVNAYWGSSRRQTTACLQLCEGRLHALLLADVHMEVK